MSAESRPIHVLHRRGGGPQPDAFRTSFIRTSLWLDLSCALDAFGQELGYRLHGDVTRRVARRALHLALEQLGEPTRTDRVRRLQHTLLDALRRRGRLPSCDGPALVVAASHYRKYGYHLGLRSHPERFQFALAAFSVVAPPRLSWHRPPSLEWWRGDVAIQLLSPSMSQSPAMLSHAEVHP
jgi:hypothetical protein